MERSNLLKEERKWKYVNITEKKGLVFEPSFFCISYFRDNNQILLIGENDNGYDIRFDYIYKIEGEENDEIEEFKCNLNESNIIFRDKFFMPIEKDKSVNFILIIGNDIKIFILDRNSGEFTIQNYDSESIN